MTSPYELLEVNPKANELELRLAYRQRIHDLHSKKISNEQFQRICRAYETLGNRTTRKHYDETKKWTSTIPPSQQTPQQLAADAGLLNELKQMLKDASLKRIDGQDPQTGHTPLYCASRTGNLNAVKYLIEQGANPDLAQRHGSTALHVSSFYGHPQVVRWILQSGANFLQKNSFGDQGNLPESEIFPNDTETKVVFTELKQEAYVQTAAHQLDWLKKHLTKHVDEQYFRLRQTLLHCAAKKGYSDIVEWLVEEKQCDLDIVDINLNSALHLAAYGGHETIVKYLIEKGAHCLLINRWGMTAEQEGLIHQSTITNIFQEIRRRDAFDMAKQGHLWWFQYHFGSRSPDSTNNEGTNLLYVACRGGQLTIARWLLEHGANVNIQLSQGSRSTPLHGAAFGGHVSIVELLLEHGADINIKNYHGETAFDNAQQNQQIKQILNKYKSNLLGDKFVQVHIYGDGKSSGNEPLAKVELHYDATKQNLLDALPQEIQQKYRCFSMARRPIIFERDGKDLSVLSAVCASRYGRTIFIEMPLCITGHESPRYMNSGHVTYDAAAFLNTRDFQTKFLSQCQTRNIVVKGQQNQVQTFKLDNMLLTFANNCTSSDVTMSIDYIESPDVKTYHLLECVYLFQIKYSQEKSSQLTELPSVSLANDLNVYLYNWVQPSAYWFASSIKHTRLPLLDGKHALIRHVPIIVNELYLLPDIFIRCQINQILGERSNPFYCRYLKIRDHDKSKYPHIAYHGTSIRVISSILMDGFVMPSTVVSSGQRVCPPPNHIARQQEVFGIPDFSNGIFLSPSISYCSDPAYAVTFTDGDQQIIAVLECAVKDKSYKSFPCTVPGYKPHPSDDIQNIEWRFTNPADIEILSVLFIPLVTSRLTAAKIRAKKLSLDPNDIK